MKRGNISLLMSFLLFLGATSMLFGLVATRMVGDTVVAKTISGNILTGNDSTDLFKALVKNRLNGKEVIEGSSCVELDDLVYIKDNLDSLLEGDFIVTTNKKLIADISSGIPIRVEGEGEAITYLINGITVAEKVLQGGEEEDKVYILDTEGCTFIIEEELRE